MKKIVSQKLGTKRDIDFGGPGSGNWGHHGRPGQRGGSAEKGTGGGDIQARARMLATKLRAAAEKAEPGITASVVGAVEELGGKMEGLDFRLKSESSIRSKLFRDVEESGNTITIDDAASGMTDLVRYTAIFDVDDFVSKTIAVQEKLNKDGWEQYDSKWRNYFVPGNVYMGYNTVMVHRETGQRYELQFHTPDSLRRKERGHLIYEQFRELPSGDPRRDKLIAEQTTLWHGFVIPPGADRLPGIVMGGR